MQNTRSNIRRGRPVPGLQPQATQHKQGSGRAVLPGTTCPLPESSWRCRKPAGVAGGLPGVAGSLLSGNGHHTVSTVRNLGDAQPYRLRAPATNRHSARAPSRPTRHRQPPGCLPRWRVGTARAPSALYSLAIGKLGPRQSTPHSVLAAAVRLASALVNLTSALTPSRKNCLLLQWPR